MSINNDTHIDNCYISSHNYPALLKKNLLLFIVVKIFLWKPLTEFLEARRDMMDKDLVEAQQAKERAEQIEAELKVKYDAAKVEIQKLLKEAEAQGNLRKEEIINEAKLEATRRLTMAKEEIEREIAMQEDDIRNQIISNSLFNFVNL